MLYAVSLQLAKDKLGFLHNPDLSFVSYLQKSSFPEESTNTELVFMVTDFR